MLCSLLGSERCITIHWVGWSREAINSSVMIILLTWEPHDMSKQRLVGGCEVKTHHGMNSGGVKLKEISQHGLRRRDIMKKLNRCNSNIVQSKAVYVHCCCGVYVYFDKQMLHGWSCIILGSKIQLYLCSYEILISISTQCKKALASVFQSLSREANRRMSRLACLFLLLAAATTIAEKCLHPPPAENYSNQLYAGQWFEVIIKLILAEWKLFAGGEISDNRRSHFPDRDSLHRGKF